MWQCSIGGGRDIFGGFGFSRVTIYSDDSRNRLNVVPIFHPVCCKLSNEGTCRYNVCHNVVV